MKRFDRGATEALESIMRGCIIGNMWDVHFEGVVQQMVEGGFVNLSDLNEKYRRVAFPCPDVTIFEQMESFFVKDSATSEDVYRFFASRQHLDKGLAEVSLLDGKIDEATRAMLIFTDIILPVRVKEISSDGLLLAVYRNGDVSVILKSLVVNRGVKVSKGDLVLAHYASVVGRCNVKLEKIILRIHMVLPEFMEVARSLTSSVVDVAKLDKWELVRSKEKEGDN